MAIKADVNDKASLVRREMEIKRLIRQMKFDQLNNSTVYRNLEHELSSVKRELQLHEAARK